MPQNRFDNLKKETIPDPITGGTQDIYTNEEGTFMMSIPHQTVPFPEGFVRPEFKWTDKSDGIKTWEYPDRREQKTEDIPCEIIQPKQIEDANNNQTSQPV